MSVINFLLTAARLHVMGVLGERKTQNKPLNGPLSIQAAPSAICPQDKGLDKEDFAQLCDRILTLTKEMKVRRPVDWEVWVFITPLVSPNMAGWEIPELNGGF